MRATARLFCSLDLPDAVVERIADWQREQSVGEVLRAVRPEALHLTVAFLGERPEEEIPALASAIREAAPANAVAATLRPEPVAVPARQPRLLALEIESAAAERLQTDLAGRLRALGAYGPERRPFWPHLTVFRVRGRAKRRAVRATIGEVGPLPDGDGHAFGFVRLALYRSELGSRGSTYYRLAAAELPQPGGRQKR